jgi:hypothetical protein
VSGGPAAPFLLFDLGGVLMQALLPSPVAIDARSSSAASHPTSSRVNSSPTGVCAARPRRSSPNSRDGRAAGSMVRSHCLRETRVALAQIGMTAG